MQYSLFDELAFSLWLVAPERRLGRGRVAGTAAVRRARLREWLAAGFVRLGIRLDHDAGERALSIAAGRVTR